MTNAEKCRRWREKNRERVNAYAAEWRAAHHDYFRQKQREWREKNAEKEKARRAAYIASHPGYLTECKRKWRAKHPEKAKAKDREYAKKRWLKIVDSYELHEARMLYNHNRVYPDKPYTPRYKARRPPTWMMHRVLWEYAGGEPTPEQKAYAIALFRKRRSQRFGEREEIE